MRGDFPDAYCLSRVHQDRPNDGHEHVQHSIATGPLIRDLDYGAGTLRLRLPLVFSEPPPTVCADVLTRKDFCQSFPDYPSRRGNVGHDCDEADISARVAWRPIPESWFPQPGGVW